MADSTPSSKPKTASSSLFDFKTNYDPNAFFPFNFHEFLTQGSFGPTLDEYLVTPPAPDAPEDNTQTDAPQAPPTNAPSRSTAPTKPIPSIVYPPIDQIDDSPVPITFLVGPSHAGFPVILNLLAQHPQLAVLHHPRGIWLESFPSMDIWSILAEQRGGRLVHGAEDAKQAPENVAAVRKAFFRWTHAHGKSQLVIGGPEHVFHLAFLREAFPEAKFVHLLRHPLAVAAGVGKEDVKAWYGPVDSRWKQILAFARALKLSSDQELLQHVATSFTRGILEWTCFLSMSRQDSFKALTTAENWHEIKFEQLAGTGGTDDQKNTWKNLIEFIVDAPNEESTNTVLNLIQEFMAGQDSQISTGFVPQLPLEPLKNIAQKIGYD